MCSPIRKNITNAIKLYSNSKHAYFIITEHKEDLLASYRRAI